MYAYKPLSCPPSGESCLPWLNPSREEGVHAIPSLGKPNSRWPTSFPRGFQTQSCLFPLAPKLPHAQPHSCIYIPSLGKGRHLVAKTGTTPGALKGVGRGCMPETDCDWSGAWWLSKLSNTGMLCVCRVSSPAEWPS